MKRTPEAISCKRKDRFVSQHRANKARKIREDKELDKRLKDTFPASDATAEY